MAGKENGGSSPILGEDLCVEDAPGWPGRFDVLGGKGGVGGPTSGHFYVDMSTPTETLVVSRDEYVDVIYPWQPPT